MGMRICEGQVWCQRDCIAVLHVFSLEALVQLLPQSATIIRLPAEPFCVPNSSAASIGCNTASLTNCSFIEGMSRSQVSRVEAKVFTREIEALFKILTPRACANM